MELSEGPLTAGSCVLRQPAIAQIVQDAIRHFDRDRYHLIAWCIMPNHVHVVVNPALGWELSSILHSWKSFTSNEINRALLRDGTLWERESFNHIIRSPGDVARFVRYVENNPVKAGLCDRPEDWPYSSCGAGFRPGSVGFVDPRTTTFTYPASRGELQHLHKPGGTYYVTWRLLDAVVLAKPGTI